jgi:hypothetical protein
LHCWSLPSVKSSVLSSEGYTYTGCHVTIKLWQAHLIDCAFTYTLHRWISLVIRATGINWQRLGAVMPLESTGKDLTQRYMGSRQLYSSVDGASYYYSYFSETLLPLQIKVHFTPSNKSD